MRTHGAKPNAQIIDLAAYRSERAPKVEFYFICQSDPKGPYSCGVILSTGERQVLDDVNTVSEARNFLTTQSGSTK